MKNEKEVVDLIINLEKELFDEECSLDEGQHSRLITLYEILSRDLTKDEEEKLEEEKEKMRNEYY